MAGRRQKRQKFSLAELKSPGELIGCQQRSSSAGYIDVYSFLES